jgi:hypothetical protein
MSLMMCAADRPWPFSKQPGIRHAMATTAEERNSTIRKNTIF